MKDAHNEVRLTDNIRAEASKSLVVVEGKNKELALRLAIADRDQRSAEASLWSTKV